MRILLIITGLGLGGAEKQVCSLADQFASRGNNVMLITLTDLRKTSPANSKVAVSNLSMSKNPLSLFRCYLEVRKIIKNWNPDVVHSHMVHANIFARLLRLTIPVKHLICSAHSLNEGGKGRMIAYRLTDWLADLTTNVSQEATNKFIALKAVSSRKAKCFYNGIDVKKFIFNDEERIKIRSELEVSNTTIMLLAVGRLTKAKDYHNLLNSYAIFNKKNNIDNKLFIVGEGEQYSRLLSLVIDLGLKGRVTFLGSRSDVNALMSACDAFILSSRWEGFGLVVAEAMASERVVIGTDCGGVKEVISEYGFLVESQNSAALSQAMEVVSRMDRTARLQLGKLAREHIVKNFNLDIITQRWLDEYQKR